jgi:HK97 family phage major capsid protein
MKLSKELTQKREAALAEIKKLADRAEAENRELTVEEVSMRDEYAADAGKLFVRAQTAATDEAAAKEAKAAQARATNGTGDTDANDAGIVHVRTSERTYRKNGPNDYFMDLLRRNTDFAASERLRRHAHETSVDAVAAETRLNAGNSNRSDSYLVAQTRTAMGHLGGVEPIHARTGDLSTADGAGGEFVPPAYLTNQFVPLARPGRVFADSVTNKDLPPGTMSINIPKIYGGTTVAVQATQNTGVSDTALETEFDTFPVVTFAGQQTVSQQLIDRSPIDFTDAVFGDLAAAQAAYVDAQCINGSGSGGQVTGALNTSGISSQTWTQATPTYMGLWSQIAKLKATIASARFLPATHVFVTPARWEWIESQFDGNDRPLIVPSANGPYNVVQVAPDGTVAEGPTGGVLLGLRAYQDYNIPANLGEGTNEDAVVVVKADDLWLYESPIVARAIPATYANQLTMLVQLYSYGAFTANRYPVSVGVISGTGTVTPVFAS